MGQKAAVLEKKPELLKAAMSDIRILKMLGLKTTEPGEGYTERYDNAQIPIESLKELVKSPDFSVEYLNFNHNSDNSDNSDNSEVDVDKLGEMMKNIDMSKLVKDASNLNNPDLSKLVKDASNLNNPDLSKLVKDASNLNNESSIEEV